MKSRAAWLFATWFGCGLFPKSPGTAGSFAAIVIAWLLLQSGFTRFEFALLTLALLYPAIAASGIVAVESGREDPQFVVVDEVLGQWLTLTGLRHIPDGAPRITALAYAFVLFRLFDILKPPPVRLMERAPGGTGIVLDDILAGVYAALVLFALGWFNLY